MNPRTNLYSTLAASMAIAAIAGTVAANPWSYGVDQNGDPEPGKYVYLQSKPKDATAFRWRWTYTVDTFAKEKAAIDDPPPSMQTIEGFNAGGDTQTQQAKAGGSQADVFAKFAAEALNNAVRGTVWAYGNGKTGVPDARSSGSSRSSLQMTWVNQNAKSKIELGSACSVSVSGSGGSDQKSRHYDPLDLRIIDLASGQTLIDSRLWDLDLSVDEGTARLEAGTFSTIGLGTGSILITAGHALLGGTSTLNLSWSNGLITSAFDDGIWDGLLPAIGTSALGPLFHIGDANGAMFFDVDLGADTPEGYEWMLGLGAGGEGYEDVVPTPGTLSLALLGIGFIAHRRARG